MDKETRPYIAWDVVQDFMVKAFTELGVPETDAEICAEVLMESDRRGIESHGVNRFKPIYVDRINKGILNPVTEVDIIRESPTTAVLDANDGMGMVASKMAMDMAIEKAKKYAAELVDKNEIVMQAEEKAKAIMQQTKEQEREIMEKTMANAKQLRDDADQYANQVFDHLIGNLSNALQVVQQAKDDLNHGPRG